MSFHRSVEKKKFSKKLYDIALFLVVSLATLNCNPLVGHFVEAFPRLFFVQISVCSVNSGKGEREREGRVCNTSVTFCVISWKTPYCKCMKLLELTFSLRGYSVELSSFRQNK